MSEIKFKDMEDEMLIDLVAENPPLYNPQVESYKDVFVRENIWKDIAEKMNRTDVDCRRRWKYIRDSYNRFKRKRKMTSRSVPAKNSKWELFERLQFLEQESAETPIFPPVSDRATASNMSFETVVPSPMSNEEPEIHFNIEENQYTSAQPSTKSTSQPPVKNRKKVKDEFSTYLKKRDNKRQVYFQELNALKETDDVVDTFGNHAKSVLRKLNPRLQIEAREEILNILTKYELLQIEQECSISSAPLTLDGHSFASAVYASSSSSTSSN
ncbi:hypothetical protein LSTR_LSTR005986 [Laodelphax striatellus]|uniref:Uncharacterized protein n=1 Tax=Laodelphax striatellus TaxID=195883 RepID=A0A482XPC6_LAOST|nr:hypothetical protein LSTR_LSTR005986 [Laodelphax striatellus]